MLSPDSLNAFGCSKHRTTHPESPRRPALSPRKRSPAGSTYNNVPNSVSQLLGSYDYEASDAEILDSIPEREWRLLAALARKKEEDDERDRLANQFRKLWQKEKEEREIVEAETLHQYKSYINEKRREERSWQEYKRYQMSLESQMKRQQLMDFIRDKERRSADVLAYIDDKRTGIIIDKVLEEEARAQLAADRRLRFSEAEQFRKHVDLMDTQKKADDARKRRNAILKDASQRAAISNAFNSWESSLLRQEVLAMDAAKRAHHAAHAAMTEARSVKLMRIRDARRRRARRIAVVTEQLREAIKSGRR